MRKYCNYWDFDPSEPRGCPCGAEGAPIFGELYAEVLEMNCPACDEVVAVLSLPTDSQTRAAAAAGNSRAHAELPNLDERAGFLTEAALSELRDPAQLPDLPGDDLVVEWDQEQIGDEHWTVLRHDGQELWRERAYWEGHARFEAVFAIVHARYGRRLRELRPTEASWTWLFGDTLSAPDRIDRLNAGLRGT